MNPAEVGLWVMLSDVPIASVDAGRRHHGGCRRRANGQDQETDRRRAHENLPRFSRLLEIKPAPARVVCRVNLTLLPAPAQPAAAAAGATVSMLRLRLLLLPLLLLGVMTSVEAARGCPQHPVMPGIMSGDTAHHRALDAAFGLGAIGRNDEGCGSDEQNGNDLHDENSL
jgi:hypothetical protein